MTNEELSAKKDEGIEEQANQNEEIGLSIGTGEVESKRKDSEEFVYPTVPVKEGIPPPNLFSSVQMTSIGKEAQQTQNSEEEQE